MPKNDDDDDDDDDTDSERSQSTDQRYQLKGTCELIVAVDPIGSSQDEDREDGYPVLPSDQRFLMAHSKLPFCRTSKLSCPFHSLARMRFTSRHSLSNDGAERASSRSMRAVSRGCCRIGRYCPIHAPIKPLASLMFCGFGGGEADVGMPALPASERAAAKNQPSYSRIAKTTATLQSGRTF